MARNNGFAFGFSLIECIIVFAVVKSILGFLIANEPKIEDENKPKAAQVEVVEKKPEEDLFEPIVESAPEKIVIISSETANDENPSWKDGSWKK